MDISTAWPKSDIHTWIYPWIYPWISISTASLAMRAKNETNAAVFWVYCIPCILPGEGRQWKGLIPKTHRRRSGWNSGGTHGEGRRWIGAEWGRICGEVSPLQPTIGSGGASWAPPAGSGAEPRPKTDFGVFWRPQNAHFCTYMTKSAGTICIIVPYSKFWGDVSPLSPRDLRPCQNTTLYGLVALLDWVKNYICCCCCCRM